MKTCGLLISTFFLSIALYAQSPVQWNCKAIKKVSGLYEVQLTATISPGWHLYSQTTPAGGPLPTQLNFQKNPLLELSGPVRELGKVQQHYEEVFGIMTKFYSDKVIFVQTIKLRSKAQTALTGTVTFMACNAESCLPPSTQKFAIALK